MYAECMLYAIQHKMIEKKRREIIQEWKKEEKKHSQRAAVLH